MAGGAPREASTADGRGEEEVRELHGKGTKGEWCWWGYRLGRGSASQQLNAPGSLRQVGLLSAKGGSMWVGRYLGWSTRARAEGIREGSVRLLREWQHGSAGDEGGRWQRSDGYGTSRHGSVV